MQHPIHFRKIASKLKRANGPRLGAHPKVTFVGTGDGTQDLTLTSCGHGLLVVADRQRDTIGLDNDLTRSIEHLEHFETRKLSCNATPGSAAGRTGQVVAIEIVACATRPQQGSIDLGKHARAGGVVTQQAHADSCQSSKRRQHERKFGAKGHRARTV